MTITAQWANAEQTSITVEIDGKPFSVPNNPGNRHRQMLAEWEAEGNVIAPYVVPVINLDADDLAAINAALTQPGTVTRALGEILFGVIKGTIPVQPGLTKPQFVALVKSRMRSP